MGLGERRLCKSLCWPQLNPIQQVLAAISREQGNPALYQALLSNQTWLPQHSPSEPSVRSGSFVKSSAKYSLSNSQYKKLWRYRSLLIFIRSPNLSCSRYNGTRNFIRWNPVCHMCKFMGSPSCRSIVAYFNCSCHIFIGTRSSKCRNAHCSLQNGNNNQIFAPWIQKSLAANRWRRSSSGSIAVQNDQYIAVEHWMNTVIRTYAPRLFETPIRLCTSEQKLGWLS